MIVFRRGLSCSDKQFNFFFYKKKRMSKSQSQQYGRNALAELPEHLKRDVTLSYFDKVILGIVMAGEGRFSSESWSDYSSEEVSLSEHRVDSGRLFSVVSAFLGLSEDLFEHVVSQLVFKGYLELIGASQDVRWSACSKGRRLRSVSAMCRDMIGQETLCCD